MVQESAAAEAAAAAAHAGAARERPTSRWDRGGSNGVDSHRLSVAPMLDCTDTHFRQLCRLLSRRVHLWTEMVNQDAVLYSHKAKPQLLHFGGEEHPLTLQLGGASPDRLARATEIGVHEYGYDEVNLNCGCPSAKVVGPGRCCSPRHRRPLSS